MILHNSPLPKTYEDHLALGESTFKFSDVLAAHSFRTTRVAPSDPHDAPSDPHVFLLCPCTWESSQMIDIMSWTKDSQVACDVCQRVFTDTDLNLDVLRRLISQTEHLNSKDFDLAVGGFWVPTYWDTVVSPAFDTVTIINNVVQPRPALTVDTLNLELTRASETKVYFKLAHFKNTLTFNFERRVLYLSGYRSGTALEDFYKKSVVASTRPVSFVRNVTFSAYIEGYLRKVYCDSTLVSEILMSYLSFQKHVAARLGLTLPQTPELGRLGDYTTNTIYSNALFLNHAAIIVAINPENTTLLNDALGFDALDTLSALFIRQADARRKDDREVGTPVRINMIDMLKLVHRPVQTSVRDLVKLRYPNFSKVNVKHFIKHFIPQSLLDFDKHLTDDAPVVSYAHVLDKISLRQALNVCDQPQVINAILTEQPVAQAPAISRFNPLEARRTYHPIRARRAFNTFYTRLMLVPRPAGDAGIRNDYNGSDLLNSLEQHFDKLHHIKRACDRKAGYDDLTQFLLKASAKTISELERKVNDFITAQNVSNPALYTLLARGSVKSFGYSAQDHTQFEHTIGSTVFSLPKAGVDLVVAGQDLSICVGQDVYQRRVLNNQTRIIFAEDPSLDSKLVIELDLEHNEIKQVKSRFNKPMTSIDNPEVTQNLNNYFSQLKVDINTFDFAVPESV